MKKYLIIKDDILKNIILLDLKFLILITPLVIYKYVDRFRANQEAWLKLFVIIGITLWTLKCLKDNKIIWKKSEIDLYIFLFILIINLSLLISGYKMISLKDYLIFLSYFFIYFLIINNIEDKRQFNSFIHLFFISSFIISVYTLLHYYGFIFYLKEFGPVISTIGQKNWISNYLALIFPIIFSFFLIEEIKRKKLFYYLLLSVLYTTLLICQSRGIWISIILTAIFAISIIVKFKLLEVFHKNRKWLGLLLATFIIITVIYSTDNPLNKSAINVTERAISTFDEQDSSINARLLMWRTNFEMIKEKPLFGTGIGTFKINYLDYQAKFIKNNPYYRKYSGKAEEAHNEYLQMGAELGIVGVGVFLAILFIFYRLVLNYLKKERSNKNKMIVLGLITGITSFLIHSSFTFTLHVPALGSAFFIIFSLTIIYLKDFNLYELDILTNVKENVKSRRYLKFIIFFNILILLIMVFSINSIVVKPYLAEVYAYKGRENLELGKYGDALTDFEYAEKLDPYNGRILLNLGATYYNLSIFKEAKNKLEQSKKYYNDHNIHRNLGLCYKQQENYQKAEEEFKYAIYLNPKFINAHVDLAYLYAIKNDYDKAIIEWNKILEVDPNFSEKYNVLYFIGLAYQRKQMPDKASEYFVQALKLAPEGNTIIEEIEKEIYNIYKGKLSN